MDSKKIFLVLSFVLNMGVIMAEEIVGKPRLELKDVSEGNSMSIEFFINNDSEDIIIIPNIYLNLFEDNFVIGNWLVIKNMNNKIYRHKTKYINFLLKYEITGNKEDYEELKRNSIILTPHQSYVIRYDDIQKYFHIPFWIKRVSILYDGPLGTSNQLIVNVRK